MVNIYILLIKLTSTQLLTIMKLDQKLKTLHSRPLHKKLISKLVYLPWHSIMEYFSKSFETIK